LELWLTLTSDLDMTMTHTHAVGSKHRVETNGWTDGGDCVTSRANTVSK